jgi:hypothetical protein
MTNKTAADREAPLTDDILLAERVAFLLERASTRQLWMMFLDADDVQCPMLMPCAGLPADPAQPAGTGVTGPLTAAQLLGSRVAELLDGTDLAQVVFAWERPGGSRPDDRERAWARELAAACTGAGGRVRAQFLVHDRGVRPLTPDDYR